MCLFVHEELYIADDTKLKRIIGATPSSNNKHEVLDDNNNHYRSMVMDAMRINHSYLGESLRVDEEPNVDAVRFF